MKKHLILAIALFLGYSTFTSWQKNKNDPYLASKEAGQQSVSTITIRDMKYQVDIADDDRERSQGLSGREKLEANQGMLFTYPTPDRYSFWMKGMRFPLDFVWMAEDKIVELTENVQVPLTDTYTPIIQPKVTVDKILEINAGDIKKYGFVVGDTVQLVLVQGE